MKPDCMECEATLKLALERVKRLEEALREARGFISATWSDTDAAASRKGALLALIDAALRPEGT